MVSEKEIDAWIANLKEIPMGLTLDELREEAENRINWEARKKCLYEEIADLDEELRSPLTTRKEKKLQEEYQRKINATVQSHIKNLIRRVEDKEYNFYVDENGDYCIHAERHGGFFDNRPSGTGVVAKIDKNGILTILVHPDWCSDVIINVVKMLVPDFTQENSYRRFRYLIPRDTYHGYQGGWRIEETGERWYQAGGKFSEIGVFWHILEVDEPNAPVQIDLLNRKAVANCHHKEARGNRSVW